MCSDCFLGLRCRRCGRPCLPGRWSEIEDSSERCRRVCFRFCPEQTRGMRRKLKLLRPAAATQNKTRCWQRCFPENFSWTSSELDHRLPWYKFATAYKVGNAFAANSSAGRNSSWVGRRQNNIEAARLNSYGED